MIVYREIANGEGYTVDNTGLAHVPYGTENDASFADDQQAPMLVYRDSPFQQQVISDGSSQPMFLSQDHETVSLSQPIFSDEHATREIV